MRAAHAEDRTSSPSCGQAPLRSILAYLPNTLGLASSRRRTLAIIGFDPERWKTCAAEAGELSVDADRQRGENDFYKILTPQGFLLTTF
jgi:hypothetical protein